MLKWDSISQVGEAGVGLGATAPAAPARDLMLEAVIAHEQIEVLFQPLIEPSDGADRRRRGAGALAQSYAIAPRVCLRGRRAAALAERLSRLVQRKALRCAAVWEGPLKGLGLSINLLPADIRASGLRATGCSTRSSALGSIPSG